MKMKVKTELTESGADFIEVGADLATGGGGVVVGLGPEGTDDVGSTTEKCLVDDPVEITAEGGNAHVHAGDFETDIVDGGGPGGLVAAHGVLDVQQPAIAGVAVGDQRRGGQAGEDPHPVDHVAVRGEAGVRQSEMRGDGAEAGGDAKSSLSEPADWPDQKYLETMKLRTKGLPTNTGANQLFKTSFLNTLENKDSDMSLDKQLERAASPHSSNFSE